MIPARFPPRLLLILLGTSLLTLATAASAAAPHPDPRFDPQEVVKLQLQALAHNDKPSPDAGVAVAFAFASPGNRAHTGPLRHFSAMIHSGFAALLNHRSSHLNPIVMRGDQALEGVELVARNGQSVRFIFVLSRQSQPPYAGCWMTDGVLVPPQDGDQQNDDQPGGGAENI